MLTKSSNGEIKQLYPLLRLISEVVMTIAQIINLLKLSASKNITKDP